LSSAPRPAHVHPLSLHDALPICPMDRVAEPLTRMGARIGTTNGLPPVVIDGTDALRAIDYALPVASAQVKSAILLAALNAKGRTDRKSTRLNSSHQISSYAVFCM